MKPMRIITIIPIININITPLSVSPMNPGKTPAAVRARSAAKMVVDKTVMILIYFLADSRFSPYLTIPTLGTIKYFIPSNIMRAAGIITIGM